MPKGKHRALDGVGEGGSDGVAEHHNGRTIGGVNGDGIGNLAATLPVGVSGVDPSVVGNGPAPFGGIQPHEMTARVAAQAGGSFGTGRGDGLGNAR